MAAVTSDQFSDAQFLNVFNNVSVFNVMMMMMSHAGEISADFIMS